MGKFKKNKPKREKKPLLHRTKAERQEEVKNIISILVELHLDMTHGPIKQLYAFFKEYICTGERIKINIPFPEIKRRIKGILAVSVNEEVWLKMEKEKL